MKTLNLLNLVVCISLFWLMGPKGCNEDELPLDADVDVHYVKSGGFADILQDLAIERSGGGDGTVIYTSDIPEVDVSDVYAQKDVEELIRVFENNGFCKHAGDFVPEMPTHNEYLYDISYTLSGQNTCNAKWMDSSEIPPQLSRVQTFLEDIKTTLTQTE